MLSCFIENDPSKCMLVLPSDHYIPDEEYFNDTIENALSISMNSNAITFGEPTYLSTQYGYIQTPATHEVEPVKSFHEKPDILTKRMIDSGEYLWNLVYFYLIFLNFYILLEKLILFN